jgi:hypothetical protein
MANDSLQLLWRGSDPAKYTALQAALRDEGIPFHDAPVYDPAGGFLSSRPYYLEAATCYEIRVRSEDFERAQSALAWVESKAASAIVEVGQRQFEHEAPQPGPPLPYDWNVNEATSEVWSGEEDEMAEYLAHALRENGIPSRIPDEPGHRLRLCVRAGDRARARDIVRQITDGVPPR